MERTGVVNEIKTEEKDGRCRNCCKQYAGSIHQKDVGKIAASLRLTAADFQKKYLRNADAEGMCQTLHVPCDFLNEDGECQLGEYQPESCRKFPYTDQPDRLQSMYSIIGNASVCPVVFEILERLKEEYHFQYKK